MTNSKELFHDLLNKITLPNREEAQAILYYLLENKLGLTRTEVLAGKSVEVEPTQLNIFLSRINAHEPIQYITGVAWFRNRKFEVNSSVLIPRPETEILVQTVVDEKISQPEILDVGTGSGCIAISLALEISNARIWAIDISEAALKTAEENAQQLNASVNFVKSDFLSGEMDLENLDFIVSNPPYVQESEKKSMEQNVLEYEPHLALFVSDNDPLIFYRTLARRGKNLLKASGMVMAEINPLLAKETHQLFCEAGYRYVQLLHDLEGKYRIIKATL